MASVVETLLSNLRILEMVPRRGKPVPFVHTSVTRKQLADVYRQLRNEQRAVNRG